MQALLLAIALLQTPDCDARAELGWTHYRAGRFQRADSTFRAGLARCARHEGIQVGAGYAALQTAQLARARALFEAVLSQRPGQTDALYGLATIAFRTARTRDAHALVQRLLAIAPEHADARVLLQRLPPDPGPPPNRPTFVRPAGLQLTARTRAGRFEVQTADGWQHFYVKGINLGAALPGKHPSEFPDSATYARWIAEMAESGANTVRVYTIHPPSFYQALLEHNRRAARPLWLMHGVWTEEPPRHDYDDRAWQSAFFAEMRRVVDLVHGRADIEPRAGHAAGYYTADVSPWVLGWIIGREWEPYSIVGYNKLRSRNTSFRGTYFTVARGTPADVWMARALEHMVAYEDATYHAQRPIAYTNWPTLDPLRHPTEATVDEEMAIRRRRREVVIERPLEYDNDRVALDATLIRPSATFTAGYFAAYHAYPYYPDFMNYDTAYHAAVSPWGRSNYFGYLQALKRHHGELPVLVAEYGVPASLGNAHMQVQGFHHGGHTEALQSEIDARLTNEIAAAGLAGGILFAWIDEWFKKNWVTIEFEGPLERDRLWLNRLDAEEQYGLITLDPGMVRQQSTLYQDATGSLSAAIDEAYLHLRYTSDRPIDALQIGFDIIDPLRGDRQFKDRVLASPVGLEFVLEHDAAGTRLLADSAVNPFRVVPIRRPAAQGAVPDLQRPPPGFARGAFHQSFNRPFRSTRNDDGVYTRLLVVTNRQRVGRDGTEYPALLLDRGVLPEGALPDGLWQRANDGRSLEVRIPWGLLNFSDPSSRRVVEDARAGQKGAPGTVVVPEIRLVAARRSGGRWIGWPASGGASAVARYSWTGWEVPSWAVRRRPAFEKMKETWESIDRVLAR